MKTLFSIISTLALFMTLASGCIKDDIVNDTIDPELRITSMVDTIAINSTFQFEYMYLNNIGEEESVAAQWSSSQPGVMSITDAGLASALQFGSAVITVTFNNGATVLQDSLLAFVGNNTVTPSTGKTGTIATTSTYQLEGDFEVMQTGDDLLISIADNYKASTALPGLYVYLTNNRNSIANALEIGAVQVFSGAHSYNIENTGINDYQYLLYYCKPFNVKVGDGEIQ